MVEGARVETWELILLVLEQLVYTNPFDHGNVDKFQTANRHHVTPYKA